MTDIVEWLENSAVVRDNPRFKEAADEIKRLRADEDHHLRAYQAMFNDNERLRAESKNEKILLIMMERLTDRNTKAILLQSFIAAVGPLSKEAGAKAKELLK